MSSVIDRLTEACKEENGVLALINVDNFGLFNDIFGREIGDKVIEKCVQMIDRVTEGDDIKARLGGDEFVVFAKDLKDKKELVEMTEYVNEQLVAYVNEMVGDDNYVSMGVSTGAVFVPENGNDYEELFHKADKALSVAKQLGNHGCSFYEVNENKESYLNELDKMTENLDEDSKLRGAMWLDNTYFSIVYRYLRRYIQTYSEPGAKMLITLSLKTDSIGEEHFNQIVREFGKVINASLRRSDVMMQSRHNQYFLLLPRMTQEFVGKLIDRIKGKFENSGLAEVLDMNIKYELIVPKKDGEM